MLSWFRQTYLALDLKAFQAQFETHFLVWEPGAWRPPPKSGATVVSVGGEAGKSAKGGDALVLMVPSTKPELTLGRGPSNDLVIDDATVSTSHLTLTLRGKSWAARTLSSTNGTWLGQRPLEASKEAQLSSDDQLRLGQVNLTFYDSKGLYFRLKSGG